MRDAIITAVASIVGTVLAAVVPLWIQNRTLKRRLAEAPAVARGLAVGYFHNFLRKISEILKETILEVSFGSDETRIKPTPGSAERVHKFSNQQVQIILIVPKRLSVGAITHATDAARLSKAEIFRGSNRTFSINYDLLERGGELILLIQDLVRPYFAMKFYLEDYLNLKQDSETWRTVEAETMAEFRRTFEELRNKGEGVAINQISWKEIE